VRYEAALQLNSRWYNGRFHWGTFAVNIAGSTAQALLGHAAPATDSWQSVAVTVSCKLCYTLMSLLN
jgi:fluoride ion exporter CrcB/FEX